MTKQTIKIDHLRTVEVAEPFMRDGGAHLLIKAHGWVDDDSELGVALTREQGREVANAILAKTDPPPPEFQAGDIVRVTEVPTVLGMPAYLGDLYQVEDGVVDSDGELALLRSDEDGEGDCMPRWAKPGDLELAFRPHALAL